MGGNRDTWRGGIGTLGGGSWDNWGGGSRDTWGGGNRDAWGGGELGQLGGEVGTLGGGIGTLGGGTSGGWELGRLEGGGIQSFPCVPFLR